MIKTCIPNFILKVVLVFTVITIYTGVTSAAVEGWQNGVTIRVNNQADEYILASLIEAKQSGANWIAITPGWLTDSKTSNNVDIKPGTPADAKLIYTIQQAHNLGLKVMLKPHLDIKNEGWRGLLIPSDINEFFTNYSSMILHYAQIAQTYNVEQLSIGAELVFITTDPKNEGAWRLLISKIREVYSGPLTYSANADYEKYDETKLPFWDALDVIGISMYRGLSKSTTPTNEELALGWSKLDTDFVQPLLEKYDKPIIFSEIGYRSVDFAADRPWDHETAGAVNLNLQNQLYQAMFEYWSNKNYLNGIHIWDWKVEPNAGGLQNTDYTPQNKPAKQVLINYFDPTGNQISDTAPAVKLVINEHTITNIGSQIYLDRTYVISKLPTTLKDSFLIKTKNADKYNKQSEYLNVSVTANATLYVAFDSRAQKIPYWLNSWELTNESITTSDTSFRLYKKSVPAGTTSLGGNAIEPMVGAKSNYFVIVTKQSESEIPTEVPVETTNTESTPPIIEEPVETYIGPGNLIIEYPENNAIVTGEKKIKIYNSELNLDKYIATWEVDNQDQKVMENSVTGGFKQAKINFDTWTWNGSGPYTVVLKTLDLNGKVTDSKTLTLFVK